VEGVVALYVERSPLPFASDRAVCSSDFNRPLLAIVISLVVVCLDGLVIKGPPVWLSPEIDIFGALAAGSPSAPSTRAPVTEGDG
jgi:hypothetical protein